MPRNDIATMKPNVRLMAEIGIVSRHWRMAMDEQPAKRRAEMDLRASDTDREHVAERLRSAAGHGRISLDELEERLEAV